MVGDVGGVVHTCVALKKSLLGLVEPKLGDELLFTVYDTSVQDVDRNTEMVAMGLSRKN
jgi:hypothetical protein